MKALAALALAAATLVGAGAARAGNLEAPAVEPSLAVVPVTPKPRLVFTLRGGVAVTPDYFGSSSSTAAPDFGFQLHYLRLFGREIGTYERGNPRYGLALRGSFRYIPKRDADDSPELTGLGKVDTSLEIGGGIGYTARNVEAFADLRYGAIGHNTFVAELGADGVVHPTENLRLSLGPRVLFGTDRYAQTYFGVSGTESVASGLPAYDPSGGLVSAGLEAGAHYDFTDKWGIEGAVTWDRLTGDAADSPIVEQGDRDQYGARIGITRRINLNF